MIYLNVFFEYVRPQQIYSWMSVVPWPKITLFGALLFTLLEGRPRFRAWGVWGGIVLFTAAIVISGFTAQYPADSWAGKDVWINWLILMFVIGAGIRDKEEFVLLLFGWILWHLKMTQHGVREWVLSGFSFQHSGVGGAPGWFQNSGEFGIELCVFVPIAGYLAFGLWPQLSRKARIFAVGVVASGLMSVIPTSSRGAFLGMACVGAWLVIRSPYRLKAGLLAVTVITAVWLALPAKNKARWAEAGQDRDSQARLTYWKDGIEIAKQYPAFGVGYNNWISYYRARYNPEGELPHNYLVEAGSQMGYTGLAVFGLMTLAFFRQNSQVRKATAASASKPDRVLWAMTFGLDGAMIGFLSSGFFVSVLFYPYYWMNLALCMALARVTFVRQASAARRGGSPVSAPAAVGRMRSESVPREPIGLALNTPG